MLDSTKKQELVSFGQSLFSRGYSVGSAGNMSVKLEDGSIAITPTNSSLGRLDMDTLAVVTAQGEQVNGAKPTKELAMHLAVYNQAPSCGAIVHLHSTYATALSCLQDIDPHNALQACTPYYVMKVGKLPIVPYFKPGSADLAQAVGQMAQSTHAFLLANHGVLVYASTLEKAVNAIEELEESIKLYFILQGTGNNIRYLSEEDKLALMSSH